MTTPPTLLRRAADLLADAEDNYTRPYANELLATADALRRLAERLEKPTEKMIAAGLDEWLQDAKGQRSKYPAADAIMREGFTRAIIAAIAAAGEGL